MKKTLPSQSSKAPASGRFPTREEISTLAAQIWRERGCPEGQDDEIWLTAEKRLGGSPRVFRKETVPAETKELSGLRGSMADELDERFPDAAAGKETTSL